MGVSAGGTQPVQSKNEDFYNLEKSNIWGDLCMLIGIFGLYIQILSLCDLDTITWR